MCGIIAIINLNKTEQSQDVTMREMLSTIKHRGPDDEGYILISNNDILTKEDINELNLYKSFIALGHRRLSILDISERGHQPMSYKSRYWIIFNGEIYNYIELKKELQAFGYKFRSNTDTEIIMAAYDYWGTDSFNKFNGMWSFVLFDSLGKKIIVSRDRFGIKPLVYYKDDQYLIFSSEIKTLFKHSGVKKEVNYNYIKSFLKYNAKQQNSETSFKNIYNFPTNAYTIIDLNKSIIDLGDFKKIWTPPSVINNKLSIESAQSKYYELLKDSVNIRLRSDVPVGSAFSGGLDSSSIVYLINKQKSKGSILKQKTFSTVYVNDNRAVKSDESYYINLMKKEYNLDSYTIEPTAEKTKNEYFRMAYMMDNPQKNSLMSYIFTYYLVRKNNVTVTLDGQGADEIQAGYIFYLVNYFSNLKLKDILTEYKKFKILGSAKRYIIYGIYLNLLRKLGLKNIWLLITHSLGKDYNPFMTLNERLLADLQGNLINLLHYGDRGAMASSVESRFPFLDYRLVNFWLTLPDNMKISEGWTKYLARLTFQNKLPKEIVWRKHKIGWAIPDEIWFKNELKDWALEILENSSLIKKLNPPNFKKILERKHLKKEEFNLFMKYFNIAVWHQVFFEDKLKIYEENKSIVD